MTKHFQNENLKYSIWGRSLVLTSFIFQLYPRFPREYLDDQIFTLSRFEIQVSAACLSDLSRYLNLSRAHYPAKRTRRNDDGDRIPDSTFTDDDLIVLASYPLLSSLVASLPERQYEQHIPTPEVVAYQHPSVAETLKSIGIMKCTSIPRETGNSYKFNLKATSNFIPK